MPSTADDGIDDTLIILLFTANESIDETLILQPQPTAERGVDDVLVLLSTTDGCIDLIWFDLIWFDLVLKNTEIT